MKNNKGSSLIVVLLVTAVITILGVSIINLSFNEALMSKSFNNSESAYYIAEAGVERVISIIDKAVKIRIDHVLNEEQLKIDGIEITEENVDTLAQQVTIEIRSFIDTDIVDYFGIPDSQSERFDYYVENNTDFDGDGIKDYILFADDLDMYQELDKIDLTEKNRQIDSYYTVNVQVGIRDDENKRKVIIDSYGYCGPSSRHIMAEYYIQDIENVDPKSSTAEYSELYNIYSKKAITALSSTSDSDIWNNSYINGDVLITCNSMTLKNNNDIQGELAIKSNFIDINNNLYLLGSTILDSNNIELGNTNGMRYYISGAVYTNNSDLVSTIKFPISASSSDTVIGDESFKYIPWYHLKLLDNIPDHIDDHDNVHYILLKDSDDTSQGIISDNDIVPGKYNVIISNIPVTIWNRTNFNGMIYSTQPINIRNNITINGIIVTNDIKARNKFHISYSTPSGYTDSDASSSDTVLYEVLDNIRNMIRGPLTLQIKLDTYSVYCTSWDTP